jgi:hypothetical protein
LRTYCSFHYSYQPKFCMHFLLLTCVLRVIKLNLNVTRHRRPYYGVIQQCHLV